MNKNPIAWEEEKKHYQDYNLGEKIAVLQLIHCKEFNVDWVEDHHPRLTRVYYNAVRSLNNSTPVNEFRNVELATIMFGWGT